MSLLAEFTANLNVPAIISAICGIGFGFVIGYAVAMERATTMLQKARRLSEIMNDGP